MARFLSTVLVLVLLGGTAAAFAVTEGLKLEKSPILSPRIDKVFSPVCVCATSFAHVGFRLRSADHLTVSIIDSDGRVVRTLVVSQRFPKGDVRLFWNGRDDAGRVVPEGEYRPRVHLQGQHRTIVLPNPIRVDVTPPKITIVSVTPRVFSPDHDFRADVVHVRYHVDEPAHALLYVDGTRHVRGRFQKLSDELRWYGRVDGHPLPPRVYHIWVRAVDLAGNRSAPSRRVAVRIRYVSLPRPTIRVAAGTRFGIHVSTDSHSYRWQLGKRRGIASTRHLVLRSPQKPGRYRLKVTEHGHADEAVVVVRPRR